jgi:hypothetical protein
MGSGAGSVAGVASQGFTKENLFYSKKITRIKATAATTILRIPDSALRFVACREFRLKPRKSPWDSNRFQQSFEYLFPAFYKSASTKQTQSFLHKLKI